jgi:hypothetical protein
MGKRKPPGRVSSRPLAVKRSLVAASGVKLDGERGRPWPIDRVQPHRPAPE